MLGPGGPKMQYLTAFGGLTGPKCNTSQCLGPWGAQNAIRHCVWGPGGPKLQYVIVFGALGGPKCNTSLCLGACGAQNAIRHSVWAPGGPKYNTSLCLGPSGAQNAIPHSVWGPQGPKMQYLTVFDVHPRGGSSPPRTPLGLTYEKLEEGMP